MLKSLIALQLRGMLSTLAGKVQKGKRRKFGNKALIALLVLYIVGVVMFSLGTLFYQIMTAFSPMDLGWLFLALAMLIAFMFSFIGSVFLAQSSLFSAKDNELLLSMPIKPGQILLSRSLTLYLMTLFIQALVLIPAMAIYWYFVPFTPGSAAIMLIMNLLLPLPVLALSILLGWLLAIISARIRRKNMVSIIFSILFLVAYFVGYSRLMAAMQNLLSLGRELATAVQTSLPPAYHYGQAITQRHLPSLGLFALFCLVPFLLVMLLVSANYLKVLTTKRGAHKLVYKGGAMQTKSLMKALVVKEGRRFINSPVYLMNTGIFLLFILALPIYLLFDKAILETISLLLPQNSDYLGAAVVALLAMMAGSVFISAPAISLEGKAFWIPQSLPIPAFASMQSKAFAHILICLPFVVIAGVLMGFILKLDALMFLMCLALPLVMTVFTAYLGLVLNLRFPKMDWRSETEPVKQSMSTFLTMSLGFLAVAGAAALYIFLLRDTLSVRLYLIICLGFFALAAGFMAWHLKQTAEQAYLNISEG